MGLVTSVMSGTLVMLVRLATALALVTLVTLNLISLVIGVMSSVTLVMLVGFAFLEIVGAGQGQNRDSLLFLFRAFEWLQNMSDVSNFCDVKDASNARLVSVASNVSDARQ